jgi:acid phosphatase type 7
VFSLLFVKKYMKLFEERPGRRISGPEKRISEGEMQSLIRQIPRGNQKFQDLPEPTGEAPYHISLDKILSASQIKAITDSGSISFHAVGDTGGVNSPQAQQIVTIAMESDFAHDDNANNNKKIIPSFFYNLGDVVYFYGEASSYYPQFYEPYAFYPAPIFAIPGNHDGDIRRDSSDPSLAAFVRNFCSKTLEITPDAGEVSRPAMIQPNVYWTLEAPFLTIIGLYSNVPEGGQFDSKQTEWLKEELIKAPKNKALVLAVHHPAFSLDAYHSGSMTIVETLDKAFEDSGRVADIILNAHVHNFQRFTRQIGERQIPYIVAGAGGYPNLHHMQKKHIEVPYRLPDRDDTILENYCDDRHGFMRLQISSEKINGQYYTVSRPQESWRQPPLKIDSFELDIQKHRLTKSAITL